MKTIAELEKGLNCTYEGFFKIDNTLLFARIEPMGPIQESYRIGNAFNEPYMCAPAKDGFIGFVYENEAGYVIGQEPYMTKIKGFVGRTPKYEFIKPVGFIYENN